MDNKTNLVGRSSAEIAELIAPHVDREFRSRQVAQWVVDRNATGFGEMTNLLRSLWWDGLQVDYRIVEDFPRRTPRAKFQMVKQEFFDPSHLLDG